MDTQKPLLLVLDAGEKSYKRKRQPCALVVEIEHNGHIRDAQLYQERAERESLVGLPILTITFDEFYGLARRFGLTSRKRLPVAEAKSRKQKSLEIYRDKLRRQRLAILESSHDEDVSVSRA